MFGHFNMPKVSGRNIKPGSTSHAARMKHMEVLDKDSDAYKWLEMYTDWKRIEKLRSSYVDNLVPRVDNSGRVHPDYLVYGTEVGRLSARDPAIQTIPRPGSGKTSDETWGVYIRGLFRAPEGYVILQADYSQAELRTAAGLAQDPFLIETYRKGRDLHSEVAAVMFGPEYTKEQRVHCKMFNFSYLYGGTEYSFAADAGLPLNEARTFVRKYNLVMTGLAAFRKSQFELARSQGYVETLTGRRRRFPLITDVNTEEVKKACVHAPVAGMASDLTLISFIRIQEWLDAVGYDDVHIIITVHDSVILEVPEEKVKEVGLRVREIMQDTGSEYVSDVPWKADVDIGPDWGHLAAATLE
jgi:DNA polymerase-1